MHVCDLLYPRKKNGITDHANPEGNGPQHSKERGWRGGRGPPQPERQRQKHQQDCQVVVYCVSSYATRILRRIGDVYRTWGHLPTVVSEHQKVPKRPE